MGNRSIWVDLGPGLPASVQDRCQVLRPSSLNWGVGAPEEERDGWWWTSGGPGVGPLELKYPHTPQSPRVTCRLP